MGIMERAIQMIPMVIIYYVVVVVMNTILNNLLFPALDNAPAGFTGVATGKLVIFIAIYLIIPLAIMMFPFKQEPAQNQPAF